jgi:hypothetical protein
VPHSRVPHSIPPGCCVPIARRTAKERQSKDRSRAHQNRPPKKQNLTISTSFSSHCIAKRAHPRQSVRTNTVIHPRVEGPFFVSPSSTAASPLPACLTVWLFGFPNFCDPPHVHLHPLHQQLHHAPQLPEGWGRGKRPRPCARTKHPPVNLMRTTNVFSYRTNALMPIAQCLMPVLPLISTMVPSPQKTAPMRTN